jgi:hypothetical protein
MLILTLLPAMTKSSSILAGIDTKQATREINVGDSKTPFKTKARQPKSGQSSKADRLSHYLGGKPKSSKKIEVDPIKERTHRIFWVLKWVVFLPLSVYALFWLLVLIKDLFQT